MVSAPGSRVEALLEGQLLTREIDRGTFIERAANLGLPAPAIGDAADKFMAIAANQAARRATLRSSYDYIVIGSGASGSVVARRLAENQDAQVLLLEAGGGDLKPGILITETWFFNQGGEFDWNFAAERSPSVNNRSITQAMVQEARRLGVALHLDCGVERVLASGSNADGSARVTGLLLADGREITATRIAANINPKLLFTRLIEGSLLPEDFRSRIQRFRCESATFRMNVALSELPQFNGMPGSGAHLGAGIIIAPSLDFMDRAYLSARAEGTSRSPIVEMLIPSTIDDSLAPPGAHVASLFCQHFRYELPDGRRWQDERDAAAERIIDTVNAHAPNFRRSILGRLVLSPLDLEERFGLLGGDIFHGALGLDQLWAARPLLGFGDYRTPLRRLYMCGSGTHPGGGVTAVPGLNAAREILKDHRSGSI